MTADELIDEIKRLDTQIEQMKHDIILADGARQAFKYILEKQIGPAPDAPQAELPKGEDLHD